MLTNLKIGLTPYFKCPILILTSHLVYKYEGFKRKPCKYSLKIHKKDAQKTKAKLVSKNLSGLH